MHSKRLAALGMAAAIVALPSAAHSQTDSSGLPVSLERIRAALAQPPPRLLVPAPSLEVPTFRVEVRQDLSMLRPLDDQPFDPTWGLPSAGELLMSGVAKIGSAVGRYKRTRATRRARKEVDDALAAFCAVHECSPPAGPRR